MRNLILAAAILLASASAQAGEISDLAAADAPVTADTSASPDAGAPLPPIQKAAEKSQASGTPAASERSRPRERRGLQLAKSAKAARLRRYENDEAKARRIAGRYGISW